MSRLTRRTFVGAAGTLAAAGLVSPAVRADEAPPAGPPLIAPAIEIVLVQAAPWSAATTDGARDRRRNAERMLEYLAAAQAGGRRHWVAFADLAVDGIVLDDPDGIAAAVAHEDDPALRTLVRGASSQGCWISFGARARVRSRAAGRADRALAMIGPDGSLHVLTASAAARGAVLSTSVGNVAFGTPRMNPSAPGAAWPPADIRLQLTTAWTPERQRHAAPGVDVPGTFTARIGGALPHVGPPELCRPVGPGITSLHAPDGTVLAMAPDCGERLVTGTLPLAGWRASRQVG